MRSTAFLLALALGGLSACVETTGAGGGASGPAGVAGQCLARAARATGVERAAIAVTQAVSYPEGDLVVLDVPGKGRIRCQADVDGKLGDLVWLDGAPAASPSAAAPAAAG